MVLQDYDNPKKTMHSVGENVINWAVKSKKSMINCIYKPTAASWYCYALEISYVKQWCWA